MLSRASWWSLAALMAVVPVQMLPAQPAPCADNWERGLIMLLVGVAIGVPIKAPRELSRKE